MSPKKNNFWPVLIITLAASISLVAGAVLAIRTVLNRPRVEATVDGLYLRLNNIQWVDDQSEHDDSYMMPPSMMPDLPPHGVFRFNAEVALYNTNDEPSLFRTSELFLRSSTRGMWPATGGEVTHKIQLQTKQAFNVYVTFDIAESEIDEDAELQLMWIRDGKTVEMLNIPHPPDHFHDDIAYGLADKVKENQWPEVVNALPPGDHNRGKELFASTYGCVSCHGHPAIPGSNAVGPHLANIGEIAKARIDGKNAAQYIYESILNPDAFVVASKGQLEDSPSAMPPFSMVLSKQAAADLVAYLTRLQETKEGQAR
jgi:mono/diheme cytochrome c family protein